MGGADRSAPVPPFRQVSPVMRRCVSPSGFKQRNQDITGSATKTPRLAGARPRPELQGYPFHAQGNLSQCDRHRQTASCLNSGSTTRVAWPAMLSLENHRAAASGNRVRHLFKETHMNKPHKHAALIHAWADGAEIQRATLSGNDWVDDSDPTWNICHEYRIKPRTVKREGWVNIYKCNGASPHVHFFIYDNFDDAAKHKEGAEYIATVKVEWEEVE